MKILSREYNIKADIEHVFFCCSDVNYLYKELEKLSKDTELTVEKRNNVIEFIGKETLFELKEIKTREPHLYVALIIPISKPLLMFGSLTVNCELSETPNGTKLVTNVISDKTPNFMWKAFIKIVVLFFLIQSRTYEKEYIQTIEQSA